VRAALLITTPELLETVERDTGRKLNTEQKQAISHDNGPLWVLAGPGSGKTEVLVLRCLKVALVDEVEPRSIILTTFTEKAARALQERLLSRKAAVQRKFRSVANVNVSDIRVGTLHSIANDIMHEFRYLPYQNIQLLDELEQLMFTHKNTAIAAEQSGWFKKPPPDDFWVTFGFLLDGFTGDHPGRWKRAKAGVDLFNRIVEDRVDTDRMLATSEVNLKRAVELYQDYAAELEREKLVDFAHLQLHFLQFLNSPQAAVFLQGDGTSTRPGVRHVLVDEYQDTNPIQELIYFQLASQPPHNLSVVGDDEQALYRFRGGDVRCILSFEAAARKFFKEGITKVYLTKNYRSLEPIVDFYNLLAQSSETTRILRELVGKPNISAVRKDKVNHPVVAQIRRPRVNVTAYELARLLLSFRKKGMITDYSDCALLVRSTRERRPNGSLTEAGEFARALRFVKVPIYNPRSRAMLEEPEVQVTLGALLEILDPENVMNDLSRNQSFQNRIMHDWREVFQKSAARQPLGKYVENAKRAIQRIRKSRRVDMELLEIFYAIISQKPLRAAQDNPEQTLRLSVLSSVLEAFTNVHGSDLTTDSRSDGRISIQWKRAFYYSFLDLLISEGLNDFEDVEESFPQGRLPIMTFHQAKGLEFPIVFVGNINVTQDQLKWKAQSKEFALEDMLKPWRMSLGSQKLPPFDALERAEQDTIRLYYVAYSRAKELLVLLTHEELESKKSFLPLAPEMQRVAISL
jgi:DNA helicase-2/ATP-dependent DNA helicase PcrA